MNKRFKIGLLGHTGHGKSSLMIAMCARAKALGRPIDWPPADYSPMVSEHRKMIKEAQRSLEDK